MFQPYQVQYLNTSHVKVQRNKIIKYSLYIGYLNTSHVKVQPVRMAQALNIKIFKYISC